MIQALLKGKVEQALWSEDCLTSNVFEKLEYFDEGRLIGEFLSHAEHYDKLTGTTTLLNEYIESAWGLKLLDYQSTQVKYWPLHAKLGEPDLAVILYNLNPMDGIAFIVEAKFLSGKSRSGKNDQLKDYYKALQDVNYGFNDPVLKGYKGKKGPLIYLTRFAEWEDVYESEKEIGSSPTVFSLQWCKLHSLLMKLPYHRITSDLQRYLDMLGLIEFAGFHEIPAEISFDKARWYEGRYFENKIQTLYHPFFKS